MFTSRLTVDTDREALDVAIACCLRVVPADARIVRILDTKHLDWFFASKADRLTDRNSGGSEKAAALP